MKTLISSVVLSACFALASGQSLERQVIGAAGEAVQNASAGLSYTVGEPVTESAISSVVSLTQGFQQVSDDEFVGIFDPPGHEITLSVYPNPTADQLNIRSNLYVQGMDVLVYTIYDLQGKVISTGDVASTGSQVDVTALAASTYTLVLESNDQTFIHRTRFVKF